MYYPESPVDVIDYFPELLQCMTLIPEATPNGPKRIRIECKRCTDGLVDGKLYSSATPFIELWLTYTEHVIRHHDIVQPCGKLSLATFHPGTDDETGLDVVCVRSAHGPDIRHDWRVVG
jgi:hypothetical protein